MRAEVLDKLLHSWHSLHAKIMDLGEEAVLQALEREKCGKRRMHILNRLYSRYSKLRAERELAELMELAAGKSRGKASNGGR
jgi:hypothetical protein